MRAIQVTQFGGPEVLQEVDLPDPVPGKGELLVSVTGVGVNFADTHQVENSYLSATSLPFVPGSEVVGTVMSGPRAGERVCGFTSRGGGYVEQALVAEALCFTVPDGVTDGQALSLLVQGLTAHHLLTTSTRVEAGESVVVHAAAGGVGNLAVQLAAGLGAGAVIATASTQAKIDAALLLGATGGAVLPVGATASQVTAAIREANGGAKVDVILEMVGGATFDGSLAALASFGRLVTFGAAGRTMPEPIAPGTLMMGSRSVIGFWLVNCMSPERGADMVAKPLAQLVAAVVAGTLRPLAGPTYPLSKARQAHEDMRARLTIGKVVLDPRQSDREI